MNEKIILWSIAAEPLMLGGLGYFLRRTGSLPPAGVVKSGDLALLAFAVISLALVWAGSQFAARRFAPRNRLLEPGKDELPLGQRIVAVALAASPGVFGFAHHLVYGADWVLLAFNLGAFVLAARMTGSFMTARP